MHACTRRSAQQLGNFDLEVTRSRRVAYARWRLRQDGSRSLQQDLCRSLLCRRLHAWLRLCAQP
jgi:hypothetical protein